MYLAIDVELNLTADDFTLLGITFKNDLIFKEG
jgi:hypothetical protein